MLQQTTEVDRLTISDQIPRILVVDSQPIFRIGVVEIILGQPNLTVCGSAGSIAEAEAVARAEEPDIILLDLDLPDGGILGLRILQTRFPEIKCIVFTASDSVQIAIEAVNTGARGYVLKSISASGLVSAIQAVYAGASFISPEFATKLLIAAQSHTDRLSHRETQILDAVKKGFTNKQVAHHLQISEKTVKNYMSSIMQKLGVSNRVAAVIKSQNLYLQMFFYACVEEGSQMAAIVSIVV